MPGYSRMQDPITVSTNIAQDRHDAMDAGRDREVVVQVNVLVPAATAGTLTFYHAAVLADNQFEAVVTTVNLAVAGPKTVVIAGHTRFLIWKTSGMNGSATFSIDAVGRA